MTAINNIQVRLLREAIQEQRAKPNMPKAEELSRLIVEACRELELSWWDIADRFEVDGRTLNEAVALAMRGGKLLSRSSLDGSWYRASFPGVDIDAAHGVRERGQNHRMG